MSQALPLPLPSTLPTQSSLSSCCQGQGVEVSTWPLWVPGPLALLALFQLEHFRMFWFRVVWPRSNTPASPFWICINVGLLVCHGPKASPRGWSSQWHVLGVTMEQFLASSQLFPSDQPWGGGAFPHPSSWKGSQAHGHLHFKVLAVPTGKWEGGHKVTTAVWGFSMSPLPMVSLILDSPSHG